LLDPPPDGFAVANMTHGTRGDGKIRHAVACAVPAQRIPMRRLSLTTAKRYNALA